MIKIIKLGRYVYINPLTVILFVICYINRSLGALAGSYLIMLIHELSHLAAAVYIGLIPSHIAIEPFGLNLKLKNKIVYSIYDEILLYMAGPCSNLIMAVIALAVNIKLNSADINDFVVKNLALMGINILPILPLDGGVIVKKLLMYKCGNKTSEKIMKCISAALIGVLATFGIIISVKSRFNYSIVFLCVFLIMNIFTQKEKYNADFVKGLMFYKRKFGDFENRKTGIIAVSENDMLKDAAEKFTGQRFSLVFVIDKDSRVKKIFTETEIMDLLVNSGSGLTFNDILKPKQIS